MTTERTDRDKPATDAQRAASAHGNLAMQRYLRYLKSDTQPLDDNEQRDYRTALQAWHMRAIAYPPYED